MAGFPFGRLSEVARYFGVPFDVGNLGEVKVASVCLGLTCKCGCEVFVGLAAFEL
jgi:hypothetical protein